MVVFAIRLGYIPSPFDDFQWVVAVEGFVLLVLLVLGVLTFVER